MKSVPSWTTRGNSVPSATKLWTVSSAARSMLIFGPTNGLIYFNVTASFWAVRERKSSAHGSAKKWIAMCPTINLLAKFSRPPGQLAKIQQVTTGKSFARPPRRWKTPRTSSLARVLIATNVMTTLSSAGPRINTIIWRLSLRRFHCKKISFFFQAEDGIRDYKVTGVQTCALPICPGLSAGGGNQKKHAGCSNNKTLYISKGEHHD